MNPFDRLKTINELQASKALDEDRQTQAELSAIAVQETILRAFKSLVEYLDNPQRITKTSVINQLQSVGTPDAMKVVEAVEGLHDTLKTHENTDLSEVTDVMKAVLREMQAIPKELPSVEIPDTVTVANQTDYSKEFKSLEKAIKAINMVAEAPVINIPKPDKPKDLSPMFDRMTEAISDLKQEQPDIKDGAMQTQDISGLITEKYTKFNITYQSDPFSDDAEKKVAAITYYEGAKRVAKLVFTYNPDGDLKGVTKA